MAAAFLPLLTAGCAGKPPDPPLPLQPTPIPPAELRGDLLVWSWNTAAKALQKIIPDFRHRYPHIGVNVDMNGTNMQARFLLALAAGVGAPDVMQLQVAEAPHYLATHRLTDLTAVAGKYREDFPHASWANCVESGRVYAIPWDIGPCAAFYKRGLFRRYDVDPEKIETWDDFIAAGQTILTRSGGRTKMLPLSSGEMMWLYEILMRQAGAQVFDSQGRICVDSPANREILALLKRMLDSGICLNVRMWGQEFMAALKDESVATYPLAVWFGGTIKDTVQDFAGQKQDWGVFRLPAIRPGGLRVSNLGGSVLVIPDQCRQKEAAWAFIEYALCTREGQVAQYRTMDLFPAYLPALKDPYFDEPDPFYGGQQVSRLFAQDVTKIPTLNRTADWNEAYGYMEQALSKWATNGGSDPAVLATLQRKLCRRLGREPAPA